MKVVRYFDCEMDDVLAAIEGQKRGEDITALLVLTDDDRKHGLHSIKLEILDALVKAKVLDAYYCVKSQQSLLALMHPRLERIYVDAPPPALHQMRLLELAKKGEVEVRLGGTSWRRSYNLRGFMPDIQEQIRWKARMIGRGAIFQDKPEALRATSSLVGMLDESLLRRFMVSDRHLAVLLRRLNAAMSRKITRPSRLFIDETVRAGDRDAYEASKATARERWMRHADLDRLYERGNVSAYAQAVQLVRAKECHADDKTFVFVAKKEMAVLRPTENACVSDFVSLMDAYGVRRLSDLQDALTMLVMEYLV